MSFKGEITAPALVPTLLAGPVNGSVFFQNMSSYPVQTTATATSDAPAEADFVGGWEYGPKSVESLDVALLFPGVPNAKYLWVLSQLGGRISVQHGDIEDA